MPSGPPPGSGGQAGDVDTRRIMAVLVTYTWRPEGQLFLIREGKNFIGAGKISSETTHRECEVAITTDNMMSSEHALILCRHGRYDLVDQKSSNGTFLNGEMVPIAGITIENYDEIKTGATVWKFIMIEPPETHHNGVSSS
jgi:pSer/pThr/pTyr-binding forkhead associated (FHA) protein